MQNKLVPIGSEFSARVTDPRSDLNLDLSTACERAGSMDANGIGLRIPLGAIATQV